MSGHGHRGGHFGRARRDRRAADANKKQQDPLLANFTRIIQLEALFTLTFFFLSGISAEDYSIYIHDSFFKLIHGEFQSTTADILLNVALKFTAISVLLFCLQRYASIRKFYWPRFVLYLILVENLLFFGWKIFIFISYGTKNAPAAPAFIWGLTTIDTLFAVVQIGGTVRYAKEVIEKMDYATITDVESNTEDKQDDEEKPNLIAVPWKRLWGLVKPDWLLMLTGLIFLFFSSVSGMIVPWAFGEVVDIVNQNDPKRLVNLVMLMFGILVAGGIAGFIRALCFTLTGYNIIKRLRVDVFRSIILQELAFFDASQTGDLVSRLTSDCQVLKNAISVNISALVRNVFSLIVALVFLIAYSWKLTMVMFSIVPVVFFGSMVYGKFVSEISSKFQDKLAEATSVAQEVISQVRTVRAFAKEEESAKSYEKAIIESHKVGIELSIWQASFQGILSVVPMSAVLLVLYYGAVLVIKGEITSGVLTSFLLYTMTLVASFGGLSSLFGDFMEAVGASQRVFKLMDRCPEIPLHGGVELPESFDGRLEFKDVTFSYPSRKDFLVLNNLSLVVEPNSVLALVGPSGQGKSTVMSIILRFYEPQSGTILVGANQINLKSLDPELYRRKIGFVSQEPVLFSGNIRENIEYGWHRTDRKPTTEEIMEAAKKANAHDFIMSFPKGYDTAVGERGIQLSGGQKQRIAIARAFLLNPTILLLDEATSALDAESEHLVQEAIDRAMIGRTVVVIAHRLSTVKNANKIAVIQNGQVVETGNHDELMARGEEGAYKKLVLRQMLSHAH